MDTGTTYKPSYDSQRILTVDSGYREDAAPELNLYGIGGVWGHIYLFPSKDPIRLNLEHFSPARV